MPKKYSLRYNPPPNWNVNKCNHQFYGIVKLAHHLYDFLHPFPKPLRMLEIGSFKGESASIFAAMQVFDSITCIEPFKGFGDGVLKQFDSSWKEVKREFWTNTRHWDSIKLIQDYSYNVLPSLEDKYYDFIYIDGSHSYEAVLSDITLSIPKCKSIIGGHDYGSQFEGVTQAVNEVFGKPDMVFEDGSWVKYL